MTTTTPTTVGLLPDYEIAALEGMITPFVGHQVRETDDGAKVISYGLSSYGYDSCLGYEFQLGIPPVLGERALVDPKQANPAFFGRILLSKGETFILPAKAFVLCHSLEYFKLPPDVTGFVIGKSTYARWGINVICTPLEAGWEGQITYEVVNNSERPVILYPGEGIAQITFQRGMPCDRPYDSGRKYQGQRGVTLGRA